MLKRLLEEQINPLDAFKKYTFDEMKEILQNWLSPESEDNNEEESEDNVGTATPNVALKPSKVNQAEKFDALFED